MDVVIGLLLIVLVLGALYSPSLYAGLTLFFAFGMLMTLAWARLGVPGLAMAEATIGAGLSSVLLYNALNKTPPEIIDKQGLQHPILATLLAAPLLVLILLAFWPHLEQGSALHELSREQLSASGIDDPVMAVLVSFRVWDTLLEIIVLLLAFLGVKVLLPTPTPSPAPWPVLFAWARILAPITVVLAGYLLWQGDAGSGGAFQAAAVLAAGAVMLRLAKLLPPLRWSSTGLRAAVLAAALIYLCIALSTLSLGTGWMHYPQGHGKALAMLLELGLTLSIAMILTLLAVGEAEELQG